MKPFDLQKALAGEPVVTRDGRKVQRVAHLPEIKYPWSVVAVIEGEMYTYNETGRCYADTIASADLFMAPTKRTVWVNLYRDHCAFWHDTKELALAGKSFDAEHIGTFPMEIEE